MRFSVGLFSTFAKDAKAAARAAAPLGRYSRKVLGGVAGGGGEEGGTR